MTCDLHGFHDTQLHLHLQLLVFNHRHLSFSFDCPACHLPQTDPWEPWIVAGARFQTQPTWLELACFFCC
jgi:hypothetical protein